MGMLEALELIQHGRGGTVKLTTHYYVLSLSEQTSRLYEAFRDTLIDIQNKGFPIESSAGMSGVVDPALRDSRLQEFIRTADRHFDHYFERDPLQLVVVGEKRSLSIFDSVTSHQDVLIGKVEGDYAATSPHDLGRIVWPIVKEVMAGTGEKAMLDLKTAESSHNVASGIDAVGHLAGSGTGGTLFVEEDYHMKGGIREADHSLIRSEDLDIQEAIDDAVDAIIEKVLEKGGNVIFLESGSLANLRRIALVTDG
jgi:hypothetical protein